MIGLTPTEMTWGAAASLSPNGTKISRHSLPPGDTTQGDIERLLLIRFRYRIGENGLFVPIHFGYPLTWAFSTIVGGKWKNVASASQTAQEWTSERTDRGRCNRPHL